MGSFFSAHGSIFFGGTQSCLDDADIYIYSNKTPKCLSEEQNLIEYSRGYYGQFVLDKSNDQMTSLSLP